MTSICGEMFDSLNEVQDIDSFLRILNFLFVDDKKLLESALDIIDDSLPIRCIVSLTSNRRFWIVMGSKGFGISVWFFTIL